MRADNYRAPRAMGHQIGQEFALSGYEVRLNDLTEARAREPASFIPFQEEDRRSQ